MKKANRKKHPKNPRTTGGFTLVEVLVTVAITVTVATIAYSLFHDAIELQENGTNKLKELNEIETVWSVLSTDLDHLIARGPQSAVTGFGNGAFAPAFMGGEAARDSVSISEGEYVLRIERDGWSNPLKQARSDLQRVGYRWFEGQLWRDYWAEKNQPLDDEPLGRRLLVTDLEEIQVRFLPMGARSVVSNDWLDSWPASSSGQNAQQNSSPAGKPVAMEVTLTLSDLGRVQRIFVFKN